MLSIEKVNQNKRRKKGISIDFGGVFSLLRILNNKLLIQS